MPQTPLMDRRPFCKAGHVPSFHRLLPHVIDKRPTLNVEIVRWRPELMSEENEKKETLVEGDPLLVCKVNQANESALAVACKRGIVDVVDYLLNFPGLLMLEIDGFTTSLHVAASGGHSAIKGRVNVIHEILSTSLESAEVITKNGETVLHLGVKNNQYEAVTYLLEIHNITKLVDRPDNDGNTVLHLATALDVVESDMSNSEAPLILPALQDAGGKSSHQLPPISIESQQDQKRSHQSTTKHHRRSQNRRREKQLERQTEGLRNVFVFIATITFAAGINPPGGFRQETGDSIKGRHFSFKIFAVCNTVAFFLSLGIVVFLVSIDAFQRKSMMQLLDVTHKVLCLSISFIAAGYIAAMWTILPHDRGQWVFVAIGGGSMVAIFLGLGTLWAKHWHKKREGRRKEKRDEEIPSSSVNCDSSNSDVDSSD